MAVEVCQSLGADGARWKVSAPNIRRNFLPTQATISAQKGPSSSHTQDTPN